jgi:hypothetical protein
MGRRRIPMGSDREMLVKILSELDRAKFRSTAESVLCDRIRSHLASTPEPAAPVPELTEEEREAVRHAIGLLEVTWRREGAVGEPLAEGICEQCDAAIAEVRRLTAERDQLRAERDAAIQAAHPDWYTTMMGIIRERNDARTALTAAESRIAEVEAELKNEREVCQQFCDRAETLAREVIEAEERLAHSEASARFAERIKCRQPDCDPEQLWRDLHDDRELTPTHECPDADLCVWEATIACAWEHGRQHGADNPDEEVITAARTSAAEEMRERAASAAEDKRWGPGRSPIADAIRALPLSPPTPDTPAADTGRGEP